MLTTQTKSMNENSTAKHQKHKCQVVNHKKNVFTHDDSAAILCELSEHLFTNGIIPYYLHLLDKANGTGHFEVSECAAKLLIEQVQNTLPGYLVPKLVKEQAGYKSKQYVL